MRHAASSDICERQDDEKLAEALKELLDVREKHGPEEKVQTDLSSYADHCLQSHSFIGLLIFFSRHRL